MYLDGEMISFARFWELIFWSRFKIHYCPVCESNLVVIKVNRIIESNSEDAKEFDLSIGSEGHLFGKVRVVWDEFKCRRCNVRYKLNEIKKYERELKKKRKRDKKTF